MERTSTARRSQESGSAYRSSYRRSARMQREQAEQGSSDSFGFKIVLSIIICVVSLVISNSDGAGAVKFNEKLDMLLSKNISVEDLKKIVNSARNFSSAARSSEDEVKIDSDVLEEMNQDDVYYINQKK